MLEPPCASIGRGIPPVLQAAVVAAGESRSLLAALPTELHRRGVAGTAVAGGVPGGGLKGKVSEAAAVHGLPALPAVKAIPILSA